MAAGFYTGSFCFRRFFRLCRLAGQLIERTLYRRDDAGRHARGMRRHFQFGNVQAGVRAALKEMSGKAVPRRAESAPPARRVWRYLLADTSCPDGLVE